MHLRTVHGREERGKRSSLSIYYPRVKVCLSGVGLPPLPVYTSVSAQSALTGLHDQIRGVPAHKARGRGLRQ